MTVAGSKEKVIHVYIDEHENTDKGFTQLSYKFVDSGRGIYLEIEPELTAKYLIETAERWLESKETLKKIQYIVSDYSRVKKSSLTTREIQVLAGKYQEASKINPTVIGAYVGTSDFVFGLIRMWQGYLGGISWETHAFRSVTDARDWIIKMMELKHNFLPTFI